MRGLLASRGEQQEKWFSQAALIEPHLSGPAFELGKLNLEKKRTGRPWIGSAASRQAGSALYRRALPHGACSLWLPAITRVLPIISARCLKTVPLNEVFNNLGAAESQLGMPSATEDYRRAVEGDTNDLAYRFNFGLALLKANAFDEAQKSFQVRSRSRRK